MSQFDSPFLAVPSSDWLCSNDLAFAIFDGFPVSPGHILVTTRRIVETWFDATDDEQAALMALVKEAKRLLDIQLSPKPDGYNVGFNSGGAAGQTVPHVHIHVIPRYHGDMPDPRGGVRHCIPDKGNYLVNTPAKSGNHQSLTLSAGQPHSPLWKSIGQRVSSAVEVDLLASFIQPSGLDLIQLSIFSALRTGAKIRILVGDYLYITSAEALRRLVGWISLADEIPEDSSLEVRLAKISKLPSKPDSFHPKAWRIVDSAGGLLVVGSSNLSKAALETGVEWNLIGTTTGSEPIDLALALAFTDLWQQATPLDDELVSSYALHAKEAHRKFIPPESVDLPAILYLPRPWQSGALESLDRIRADAYRRALVAVATGLGKTWLAAFDVLAAGRLLDRQPRVLVIAHFLPKGTYPFSSVNFRNLAPMCHECNSSYKLQLDATRNIDPIKRKNTGVRRKAFYTYAASPSISLTLTLTTGDVTKLTPAEIDLQITAPGHDEEVEAWREVFGIDERYKSKCCGDNDGKAWLQNIVEECANHGQSPDDLLALTYRAADRAPYDGANFLRKAFLQACRAAKII